ncbi:MAG: cell division protein FtsX [Gammaproteobacteria bacterium]|nr:cell division protein FtsX [Gammaproteobacteria bacterium]
MDPGRVVTAWLSQHIQALLYSAGQMCRNPLGSLLTTAVIGISLALPAAFYLVLANSERVASAWGGAARVTLFLKMDVTPERAQALATSLRGHPRVLDVRVISPDEALAEFRRASGFGDAIEQLEENPLPAALLIQPDNARFGGTAMEEFLAAMRALPEADTAQFDRQWVQRLVALLNILHRAVLILAALLALAVLLIIGNTIRLSIYNRRTEIEINMLFGATGAFIQRPFLYSGILHGLVGALLAWLLVSGAVRLLQGPVAELAGLYASEFVLHGLAAENVVKLLGIGGVLGWVGSWLAVQRHLRDITPL